MSERDREQAIEAAAYRKAADSLPETTVKDVITSVWSRGFAEAVVACRRTILAIITASTQSALDEMIAELKAQTAAMLEKLKAAKWIAYVDHDSCSGCGNYRSEPPDKESHHPDCPWLIPADYAAALAERLLEAEENGRSWEYRHHHDPEHDCCVECQLRELAVRNEVEATVADREKRAEDKGWDDCLDEVRKSLSRYPALPCDTEIGAAVEHIVEIREKRARETALREIVVLYQQMYGQNPKDQQADPDAFVGAIQALLDAPVSPSPRLYTEAEVTERVREEAEWWDLYIYPDRLNAVEYRITRERLAAHRGEPQPKSEGTASS